MEMNETITVLSLADAHKSEALVVNNRMAEHYGEALRYIRALTKNAEHYGDGAVKVSWSTFHTRTGHLVEKCAIQWQAYDARMTDVVWIKRGRRY